MLYIFNFILFQLPLGAHPDIYSQYADHINEKDQTFTCFDNSKTIPLSAVNDNFQDCPDGSDEPGTPASEGVFYCSNQGSTPIFIPKWSVWDGNCDCCDGSDERFNPHMIVPCFNNCVNTNTSFNDTTPKLIQIYSNGLSEQAGLAISGKKLYDTILDYTKKNSQCKKDPPNFGKSLLTSIWKFTFRAPRPKLSLLQAFCYQHIIEGFDYDDINNIILLFNSFQKEIPEKIEKLGMANIGLYGSEYIYSNYFLKLFKNIKIPNGHTLPLFSRKLYSSIYKKGKEELKIDFICNDFPKLIKCYGRNTYHCFFGSPTACNKSVISDLSHMTPLQISETLNRIEGNIDFVF